MKIELTPEQEDHVVRKSLMAVYKNLEDHNVEVTMKLERALQVVLRYYSTPEQWTSFFKEEL